MEAISVVEFSLACAGVVYKTGQLIAQLRHAPDELLALSNEICDLRNVIETTKRALASRRNVEVTGIAPQLFLANVRFEELNQILKRLGSLGAWGDHWDISVWERLLWKKDRKKVIRLQQQLREIRTNISLALEANSISACFKLGVDLQDFVEETERFQRGHEEAILGNRSGIDEIRNRQRETNYLLEALVQAMPQLTVERTRRSTDSDSTVVSPTDEASDSSPPPYSSIPRRRTASSSSTDSAASNSSELTITKKDSMPDVVAIPVTSSNFDPNACWSDCACDCHKRQTYKTPAFLSSLAGRLSIGYNGSMLLKRQCSEPNCHRRSGASPQMMYFFPSWFLRQAVSLSMMNNSVTPHLSIKVRRVVPEVSQLFQLAKFGDVKGIQQLFSAQQASPDDVHVVGGWTALHFAVDHGSPELCRLLLDQGADANWEDGIGSTPIEYARRNVLMPRVCARAAEVYSVVISKAEHLQERYFSRLHELVLGLAQGDIEDEIRAHPSTMHARDVYGWTPLHWAARRGDAENTALLLKHGADPFLKTLDDESNPVHLAARGNSASVIRICLEHSYKGRKLDINDWDHRARTGLRISAGNNCVAAAALLIELGAEVDNADHQNETALLSCLFENAHDAIPLLIKAGASPLQVTRSGNTLLHFAANESDLTTLSLLTKARFRDVDINAINHDGLTGRELASARISAPNGFLDAFDRLLTSIRDATAEPPPLPRSPLTEKALEAGQLPKRRAHFAFKEKLAASYTTSRPSSTDSAASNHDNAPPSRASTLLSDAESFKSFDEMIWSEAEDRGLIEIAAAEWEFEQRGRGLAVGYVGETTGLYDEEDEEVAGDEATIRTRESMDGAGSSDGTWRPTMVQQGKAMSTS